ncbi:hypothetical protein L0V05_18910 [Tabrizicola sp. J26]|uniref:bestrophin-like domain n=1 Tax=Alitabrizicola rongguiensis TaxID=2909234 RepID=UPI001F1C52ED|nr:hypothetical protein [Tabrizicola rongguiensis]MCF1710884.1 hypothetical protein [Tabrizicola rongguiensis]
MSYAFMDLGLSAALFLLMLAMLLLGASMGRRRREKVGTEVSGAGAVDGAVYALLGLLVAFTFSGAASRFDERRSLIVEEANDIGTAYLRLDLLPADAQPGLRDLMRRYTESRLKVYQTLPDLEASYEELALSQQLQSQIWTRALEASRRPGQDTAATMLLLPALNAMFDITTTRTMASLKHPPKAIFGMLFAICLLGAMLAGFNMGLGGRVSLLHAVTFPAVMSIAVNLILDMEHPRLGLITVDSFDQVIADTLANMTPKPD